jgi:hypothetical protein
MAKMKRKSERPAPAARNPQAPDPASASGQSRRLRPDAVVRFILSHGGRTPAQPKREPGKRSNGAPKSSPLRFIDLFCGIGGFRIAFERAGATCVFSSDWDKFSRQTYAANFGEEPRGDITKIPVEEIPPFDILCGGFPCHYF